MQSGYVKSHAKGNKKQNGAGEKEQRPPFNQVWRALPLTPKILEAIPRSPGSN